MSDRLLAAPASIFIGKRSKCESRRLKLFFIIKAASVLHIELFFNRCALDLAKLPGRESIGDEH